jgi:hypothetical protein
MTAGETASDKKNKKLEVEKIIISLRMSVVKVRGRKARNKWKLSKRALKGAKVGGCSREIGEKQ